MGNDQARRVQVKPVNESRIMKTGDARGMHGRRVAPREFDVSSLREGSHGRWIHRDYAAHYFRWGFARRFIMANHSVLDAGCGSEAPLATVLCQYANTIPRRYVGTDYGTIGHKALRARSWTTYYEKFDMSGPRAANDLIGEHGLFDRVVSYEVLEHMTVKSGVPYLRNLKTCLADDGILLLSTPVFNGRAAANHVHEYTLTELAGIFEKLELEVEDRFGTFMNLPTLELVGTPSELSIVNQLRAFYDDTIISNFLAPLYPDSSRNCVWVLRHKGQPRRPALRQLEPAPGAVDAPPTRASARPGAIPKARTVRPPRPDRLTSKRYLRGRLEELGCKPPQRPAPETARVLAGEVREKFEGRTTKEGDVYFVWKNWQKELGA